MGTNQFLLTIYVLHVAVFQISHHLSQLQLLEPVRFVVDPPSVQIAGYELPSQVQFRTTNVDHWLPSAPPAWRLPCATLLAKWQPSIVMFWQLCVRSPPGTVTFLQDPCADHANRAPPEAFATLPSNSELRSSLWIAARLVRNATSKKGKS